MVIYTSYHVLFLKASNALAQRRGLLRLLERLVMNCFFRDPEVPFSELPDSVHNETVRIPQLVVPVV